MEGTSFQAFIPSIPAGSGNQLSDPMASPRSSIIRTIYSQILLDSLLLSYAPFVQI